jgi:cyclopropane-fatty-acyl-phospholipid synthase
VTRLDRWLASLVQRSIASARVRLELWDGSSPYGASGPTIGDLVVDDRRALLGIATNPDLNFGEAYMAGRLHVRGPMRHVFAALSRASLADSRRLDRL